MHPCFDDVPGLIPELKSEWGSILEVWEGYAADKNIFGVKSAFNP